MKMNIRKLQTENTKLRNLQREKTRKDNVSEIAVTEEICQTETENKSNTERVVKR